MRSLDLKEFLALIQEDIKELDERRRQLRQQEKAEKSPAGARKGRHPVDAEQEEEPVIPLSLHVVTCCGKKLGSFPGPARVRCPFCERWHRAGDFPTDHVR
jgi:hypothetical protein